MALSFHASLCEGKTEPYLYRVILDGGRKVSYVLVDTRNQEIVSVTSAGKPTGGMKLSLVTGDVERVLDDDQTAEGGEAVTTEEFTMVSASIRSQLLRNGTPPENVRKVFA